jgi:hypothetical protein
MDPATTALRTVEIDPATTALSVVETEPAIAGDSGGFMTASDFT